MAVGQAHVLDYGGLQSQSNGTHHQTLQLSLTQRERGGPLEQTGSTASRLRNTRSCEILHSSMEEPLARYKSLESLKPRWQASWQRYHKDNGIRVVDQDTIVVSARDKVEQTKKGLLRSSSGSVTYSHTHKLKAQLDVEALADILADPPPGGGHYWTPRRLEFIFKERTGRPGSWVHYDVGIKAFLVLFPRTFEVFGPKQDYIRLVRKVRSPVLDNAEDAMVRLAQAKQDGVITTQLSITHAKTPKGQAGATRHQVITKGDAYKIHIGDDDIPAGWDVATDPAKGRYSPEKSQIYHAPQKAVTLPDLTSHRLKAAFMPIHPTDPRLAENSRSSKMPGDSP